MQTKLVEERKNMERTIQSAIPKQIKDFNSKI
jgi:hypothetical protein